jgi:hypothetical protein
LPLDLGARRKPPGAPVVIDHQENVVLRHSLSFGRAYVLPIAFALLIACGCEPQTAAQPPSGQADGAAPPEPDDRNLTLTEDEIAALGLQTSAVERASYTPRIEGYGVVMSLDTLAQMDSELSGAEAAVRQSGATFERFRGLSETIGAASRNELDLAERQALLDQTALALAQRKAAATFGTGAPWLTGDGRAAWLARFAAGRVRLVHATFPIGAVTGPAPSAILVSHLDPLRSAMVWRATPVWDAPADPTIPGRSFFAVVADSDVAEGERVLAAAPSGAAQTGVLVPADAVVVSEGQAWCYVMTMPGTFVRRAIDLGKPLPGGYFAQEGLEAGDLVVTAGTGLLLAREMNPSTEPEE